MIHYLIFNHRLLQFTSDTGETNWPIIIYLRFGLTKTCRDAVTRRDAMTVNNPTGDALSGPIVCSPRRDTGRIRHRDAPGRSACRCSDN